MHYRYWSTAACCRFDVLRSLPAEAWPAGYGQITNDIMANGQWPMTNGLRTLAPPLSLGPSAS